MPADDASLLPFLKSPGLSPGAIEMTPFQGFQDINPEDLKYDIQPFSDNILVCFTDGDQFFVYNNFIYSYRIDIFEIHCI
jgi:hypothetical protein